MNNKFPMYFTEVYDLKLANSSRSTSISTDRHKLIHTVLSCIHTYMHTYIHNYNFLINLYIEAKLRKSCFWAFQLIWRITAIIDHFYSDV